MDSKFYVSYEAARLLKEKGYNKVSNNFDYVYLDDGELYPRAFIHTSPFISAPTKAEAIDWLESKGIIVELSYDDRPHKDFLHWEYFVYVNDKDGWLEAVVCSWEENNYYKTRLEAEEAAIIKACELL